MEQLVESWGRVRRSYSRVVEPEWRAALKLPDCPAPLLAYGLGRSYGDSCQNDGGIIIKTSRLKRLIAFDRISGRCICEAGITFADLLDTCLPQGWFPPVTPGTKFVTVGGAIANDIHGKNHHAAGTFGRHVRSFELLRSDNSIAQCSANQNPELFAATVGGLGLTGVILSAEIQLIPVRGPYIDVESIQFRSLDEFREISAETAALGSTYSVAWLDCVSGGVNFGRGIFMRGNHSDRPLLGGQSRASYYGSIPFDAPSWIVNPLTMRVFNTLYFHKQTQREVRAEVHYDPFFYPLDAVHGWNRLYGSRGFYQFQCVVPNDQGLRAIKQLLREIVSAGTGSFLAVLKEFGELPSPGILSFPRPGVTLALDFPSQGDRTVRLLRLLDILVREVGGAIYPAKDACMDPGSFHVAYPRLAEFIKLKDPRFSSSLWRRLTGESAREGGR